MSDEQDMRKMGGLASSFPFTYAMMLMGSLSLIGFPFPNWILFQRLYHQWELCFLVGKCLCPFHFLLLFSFTFLTFLGPTNSFGETSYDVMMRPFYGHSFNTSGSRESLCRILGQV
ncbi:hypothetical protein LXL04_040134 [Taraxacum kok-saghyz]